MEAFSELADPAHFEQLYDSVEAAEKFLRDSYNKAEWRGVLAIWRDQLALEYSGRSSDAQMSEI